MFVTSKNSLKNPVFSHAFGMEKPTRSFSDGYRYGFNGQEKTDELGSGHTTAMFWEYDARLGRRWNLDPKPNESISQYACFANNPIWFSDPLGDTLEIVGKEGVDKHNKIVDEGLGGFYKTKMDGKKLNLESTEMNGPMTEEQSALYKVYNDAISSAQTTTINATQHSEELSKSVFIGSWDHNAIDIDDILQIDNTGGLITQQGALAHEVAEQYAKQAKGISDYNIAHDTYGVVAENAVNGTKRGDQIRFISTKTGQGIYQGKFTTKSGNLGIISIEFFNYNVTKPVVQLIKP